MTLDELKQAILELLPNAYFDEEYWTKEIMISTGYKQLAEGEELTTIEEIEIP